MTTLEASPPTTEQAALLLLETKNYTDDALVDRLGAQLREQAPVQQVEHPAFPPQYVLTRHRDRDGAWHGLPAVPAEADVQRSSGLPPLRMLIHMDGEEHRAYRAMTASWFTRRNLGPLQDRIAQLAREAVERMVTAGGRCDFATDIAMPFPLQVILSMLGLRPPTMPSC